MMPQILPVETRIFLGIIVTGQNMTEGKFQKNDFDILLIIVNLLTFLTDLGKCESVNLKKKC